MFLSQHLSVRAKEERTDIFAHSLTLLSWPEAAVIILLFKTLVQTAWLKGQTEPPHLQEPTLWRHKHLYRCQSCHPTEISQGTLSAQEAQKFHALQIQKGKRKGTGTSQQSTDIPESPPESRQVQECLANGGGKPWNRLLIHRVTVQGQCFLSKWSTVQALHHRDSALTTVLDIKYTLFYIILCMCTTLSPNKHKHQTWARYPFNITYNFFRS